VIGHVVAQVIGGAAAAALFYMILAGAPAGKWNDFVAISNIYGDIRQVGALSAKGHSGRQRSSSDRFGMPL
jgi:hypothetical protein